METMINILKKGHSDLNVSDDIARIRILHVILTRCKNRRQEWEYVFKCLSFPVCFNNFYILIMYLLHRYTTICTYNVHEQEKADSERDDYLLEIYGKRNPLALKILKLKQFLCCCMTE